MTASRFITALPVFNEQKHVVHVLDQVARYSPEVVVIDDGSTDSTAELLAARRPPGKEIRVITHEKNLGYGAALKSAFDFAIKNQYDILVTIDCDGQHEPERIGELLAAASEADIVSGSRYLKRFSEDADPPAERREINMQITAELNRRLGLNLTDAFCGFKAYRVESLSKLSLTETGYAMPLELWVQAAKANFKIIEVPIPLIYLDERRSFGGALDDASTRKQHYLDILDQSIAAMESLTEKCEEGTG